MQVIKLITDLQGDHKFDDHIIADVFARTEFEALGDDDEQVFCTEEEWKEVITEYMGASWMYVQQLELISELVQDKIDKRNQ